MLPSQFFLETRLIAVDGYLRNRREQTLIAGLLGDTQTFLGIRVHALH